MSAPGTILVSRCESCHGRFLPREGPCPRCGSRSISPLGLPAFGVVVAAVELAAPAAPWPAPHRLALVELEESVRVLALVGGPLPHRGDRVGVVRDGGRYLVAPS
jgi:uncharacterized OB-fold protein